MCERSCRGQLNSTPACELSQIGGAGRESLIRDFCAPDKTTNWVVCTYMPGPRAIGRNKHETKQWPTRTESQLFRSR
jgi:hypothetical protein